LSIENTEKIKKKQEKNSKRRKTKKQQKKSKVKMNKYYKLGGAFLVIFTKAQ